ncbi:MAG: hypothetical protein AMJ88_07130 [Anaerolineae bacterium SM23_ 63]|nr:MAG: hypothetical protein AMJ88_07130 [Anaerolineae bacterium SM23_ 63]HEY46520.1 hypothetical protein [Anaerolineae bacterium]
MTALILRVFSCLVAVMLAVNLIARSRTWYEAVPSSQAHLEAALLGVLSGLLIASLGSLIKLILRRFLVSTRNEVIVTHSHRLINESDEHHPGDMFCSQVKNPDDQRRKYFFVDTFEFEMHEEMG